MTILYAPKKSVLRYALSYNNICHILGSLVFLVFLVVLHSSVTEQKYAGGSMSVDTASTRFSVSNNFLRNIDGAIQWSYGIEHTSNIEQLALLDNVIIDSEK